MAKELVNLSNKLENMQEKLKEYPELQDKFNVCVFIWNFFLALEYQSFFYLYSLKKLNIEYNALLQMYGEKTEENDELKMDLQDVKEMYKLQVSLKDEVYFLEYIQLI